VLAIFLGVYAVYMSARRDDARRSVREALTRVEQALAFYVPGSYLQNTSLYPIKFRDFPKKRFQNWSVAIVVLVGIAFAVGIYLIATF